MTALRCRADDVAVGASFGNEACYIRTTPSAGIDHLYVAASGRWYFGDVKLCLTDRGLVLRHVETTFDTAVLRARFEAQETAAIVTVFVPPGDGARVYLHVRLCNASDSSRRVQIVGQGTFAALPSAMHRQQPRPTDIARTFTLVENATRSRRIAASADHDRLSVEASSGRVGPGEREGTWGWRASPVVAPGGTHELWLCLTVARIDARPPAPDGGATYANLLAQAAQDAAMASITTQDDRIDTAIGWAKANTGRVCHRFKQGCGFTNDPPGSILVTRDVAWFVFGADWYRPDFCRRMLDTLSALAPYPDGKIAEYLDLNSSPLFRSDYGLNIADPTPLYILAVHHHSCVTGDLDWLAGVYPTARAAAAYLIVHVQDSIVVCTSRETGPGAGQCGWRNVLDGIRITGATTELQALSIAALQACSGMAAALGVPGEATAFAQTAAILNGALRARMLDPATGRYRLALDPDHPDDGYGRDDTLDQVFPLLFGLADADLAQRTVAHVLREPYRTPAGLRTVPADSPTYHPHAQWGLIGGVWPNATAWAATAIAPYRAEEAWRLARTIAEPLFVDRPRDAGALVPGQFAEWFDGESGESKGMALSSWMPPTFVWLVVEGLLGIRPTLDGLQVHPHLPDGWREAEVRNLRYRGRSLSLRITPEAVHTSYRDV